LQKSDHSVSQSPTPPPPNGATNGRSADSTRHVPKRQPPESSAAREASRVPDIDSADAEAKYPIIDNAAMAIHVPTDLQANQTHSKDWAQGSSFTT